MKWNYEKSAHVFDGQVIVAETEDGSRVVMSSFKQHANGTGPLVAAAPELLATAEKFAQYMYKQGDVGKEFADLVILIAKAKGE